MVSPKKIAVLPIGDNKHTEILGYRCGGKKSLWKHLDWRHWSMDGPTPHLFNAGGNYFHVRVKGHENSWYRVRCYYAGRTYRGREVVDIGICCESGIFHWIVKLK